MLLNHLARPPRHPRGKATRRTFTVPALAAGTVLLAGCSVEDLPWDPVDIPMASEDVAAAQATTDPAPTPSASPVERDVEDVEEVEEVEEVSLVVLPNDLASGAAERELSVGAVDLTVDYWSDLPMERWTAQATKPVTVSVLAEPVGLQEKVYLSGMTVRTTVLDARGEAVSSTPVYEDRADVDPGFAIHDPYTYGATVIIPPVDDDAAAVDLVLTWDILTETAPASGEYAKHSATDTLTITLAEEAA